MEELIKKPITAELREMRIGDRKTFPMERYSSITTVISRLKRELMREKWNVKKIVNKKDCSITILRVS